MTRARDLANLIGSGNFTTETLTATAGQTAFTPSNTFTSNFLQVFYNGLLLDPTVDYTENGTTITLTVAATAGDEMEVVTYNTFSVGDAITQTEADNRYVNAAGDTMSGPLEIKQSQGSAYGGWATALNLNSYYPSYDETAVRATIDSGIPDTGVLNTTYGWIGLATRGGDGLNRRLVIDSSGRVTMPYQPAFHASHFFSSAQTYNIWDVVKFNYAITNVGNHFNTSTYKFTAPVAGKYMFQCGILFNNGGSTGDFRFIVNNVNTGVAGYGSTYYDTSPWIKAHATAVFSLNANDVVHVAPVATVVIHNDSTTALHCQFSGYLIG